MVSQSLKQNIKFLNSYLIHYSISTSLDTEEPRRARCYKRELSVAGPQIFIQPGQTEIESCVPSIFIEQAAPHFLGASSAHAWLKRAVTLRIDQIFYINWHFHDSPDKTIRLLYWKNRLIYRHKNLDLEIKKHYPLNEFYACIQKKRSRC